MVVPLWYSIPNMNIYLILTFSISIQAIFIKTRIWIQYDNKFSKKCLQMRENKNMI